MSFLKIKDIHKNWGDETVLDSISLEIQKGEFLALLGESGSGKSTLLQIISGITEQTSGQIHIDGKEITHLPAKDREISTVFQTSELSPELSVSENILLELSNQNIPLKEQQKRLDLVLDLFSLRGTEFKQPNELSDGQYRQAVVARAIISENPICLLDEPLNCLDTKLRNKIRAKIRDLQKQLGLTIIYITHDHAEAMSIADRIALFNKGKIEQVGTPEELYRSPKTPHVASFIGNPAMNLISINQRQLGIRPEHIHLSSQGSSEQKAMIQKIDYHGEATLLSLCYKEKQISAKLEGYRTFNEGDYVYIKWDKNNEYVFN